MAAATRKAAAKKAAAAAAATATTAGTTPTAVPAVSIPSKSRTQTRTGPKDIETSISPSPIAETSNGAKKRKQKSQASSAAPNGDNLLNAKNLAFFKTIQQQLEKQKKVGQEADDAAIQARNKELMAVDGNLSSEDEDDDAPLTKRARTTNQVLDLSEDEAEMATTLDPIHSVLAPAATIAITSTQNVEDEDEEDIYGKDNDSDDENNTEQNNPGQNVEDWDITDNGIIVNDADDSKSLFTPASRRSSRSATPGLKASRSYKITESDFSPRTRELAIASKSHVRMVTIYDTPFPPVHKAGRVDFAWKIIKEVAKDTDNSALKKAFKKASSDLLIKKNLMTFTMYGRNYLISNIITRARECVKSNYGLKGEPANIVADIRWLLEKAHFIFGDLNIQNRTFDNRQPFLNELIIELIEKQWFPSSSRSKPDGETTARIIKENSLPITVILLVTTAIEHALREWANGHKAIHILFSEDAAKQSYGRLEDIWTSTEKNTKLWAVYCRKTILKKILRNQTGGHSNVNENIATLDFSELDRIAEEAMAADD